MILASKILRQKKGRIIMESNRIDFQAMPQTAIKVITTPADFFKSMPKTGGFVEPLVFMAIMGAIGGLIAAVASFMGLGGMGMGMGGAQGLLALIMVPLFVAIGGFISAAILFVIWKLLGSQENYEVAYRCVAYMSALIPITSVLGLIPYVGGAAGIAVMVYYTVIASTEVHGIAAQKAWLTFGIIGAIFILISIKGEYTARQYTSEAERFRGQMSEEMKKQADAWKKAAESMKK
jgi:hypothetical protein